MRKQQPHANQAIDDALDRLLAELPNGETLSQTEIAAAVGCTPGYISQIEIRAKKKIKHELERRIAAGTFTLRAISSDQKFSVLLPRRRLAGAFE